MKKNWSQVRGFTIIELLIAIAIIGSLAGIIFVTFPASQKRARDTQRKSDLKQYLASLGAYSNKTGGVYPAPGGTVNLTSLCTTVGVSTCPDDPRAPSQHYQYQADNSGTRFVLWASLENTSDDWAACSSGLSGILDSTPIDGDCPITTAITSIPTAPPPPPTSGPTSTPVPTATPIPTPAPVNIVNNPGFESGTSPWAAYTDGSGSFTTASPGYEGSFAARISISTPGSNVQVYQYNLSLEPATAYRLEFTARSNSGHNLSVFIHKHTSPYTNYGLNNYVANLTPSWQTFSTTFTSTNSVPVNDARLRFWFAPYDAAGDVYWIDSVVLTKI